MSQPQKGGLVRTIPARARLLWQEPPEQDTVGGASVLVPLAPNVLILTPQQRRADLDPKASETLRCVKPPEGGLNAAGRARATARERKRLAVL